ncbi:MASE3 domain-containing protein [Pseudodesulfovibrio sp.]|uniref:sensor histidine kinase n=1 Tax=unclassified Pseudodesulfovibrio TaxID=2661612 RepID=UPI003B003F25
MFSIVVAFGIFVIGWNSRSYINNNYLLFLAIAYLFIGLLDLLHTLSYKGMGIFTYQYYANQLWIATRYLESLSLLVAFLYVRGKRQFDPTALFAVFTVVTLVIIASIFWWHIFPVCFVEGQGLTPFKKNSEYIISTILLVDIVLLWRLRDQFPPKVHRWLIMSLAFTIASELSFTFYISNYGVSNLVGHYFKIFSFFLIYKALVVTGLTEPHAMLFKALQDSESKFRSMVETSSDIIWEKNLKGIYTYVSPHVENILGYKPEEMVGRPAADFMSPEEGAAARAVFASPGNMCPCQVNRESTFIHRDGHHVVLERHGMTILGEDGAVIGYRGVDRDITKRKEQEQEMRKLVLAVEKNPNAIVITNPYGVVEYGNPAFFTVMGIDGDPKGKALPKLLEGVEDPKSLSSLLVAFASGESWQGELHRCPETGECQWMRLSIAPVATDDGKIANYVGVLSDVTDRKELELLRESVDQIMRHDLKNPLAGIINIPGLLLGDDNLTEDQRALLSALGDASHRMWHMVNNSLDLSKMERGTYEFIPESVDVFQVLDKVIAELGGLLRASEVEVKISHNGVLPEHGLSILATQDLLHSILSNLLANAVEASPVGGVVSVEVGSSERCFISICNRGAVPMEMRGKFFHKYKTYGKRGGTGLGTYSAKLQADAMGMKLLLDIDDELDETIITLICLLADTSA